MQKFKKPMQAKKGTLKRLLKLVFERQAFKLVVVLVLMVISTFTNVIAVSTIQEILTVSVEMVETNSTNFSEITTLMIRMILFYVVSITFSYSYLRIMVDVGTDSLLHRSENK